MKDYRRIGWRTCPRCGELGFAYFRRGHYEVKHHPQVQPGGKQLTFIDSGLEMAQKKQKTCYVSRHKHHFAIVTTVDRRLKKNRIPTPGKIAVFANGGTAHR